MTTGHVGMAASAVAPRVVYAGWWRRGWALVFDWTILGFASGINRMATGSPMEHVADLLWFAFVVGYVVLLTATGGTPGKRILGMRVVRVDGTQTGIGKALIRELLKPFTVIPLGLGWLWMLDEPNARTWHDLTAGTVVVRELPGTRRPAWSEQPPWRSAGDTASDPSEHALKPDVPVPHDLGGSVDGYVDQSAGRRNETPRVPPPPPPSNADDSADHIDERD